MDEMQIESRFATKIISKLVERILNRKLGCNASIDLNQFRTAIIDEKICVHLDVDAEIGKEDLTKILERLEK